MKFFRILFLFISFHLVAISSMAQQEGIAIEKINKLGFQDSTSKKNIQTFVNFYNSQIPEESKKVTDELIKILDSKGFSNASYISFVNLLESAKTRKNLSVAQYQKFVTYLNKELKSNNKEKGQQIIKTLENYFTDDLLIISNYHKIYALGGSFDFEYFENKKPFFEKETKGKISEDSLFNEVEIDSWDNPNLEVGKGNESFVKLIPVNGLILDLKNVNLVLVNANDSLPIKGTNGGLALNSNVFSGDQGEVNWENRDRPSAKASLSKYSFNTENSRLVADEVIFEYPEVLKNPIKGVFEYKSEKNNQRSFPRFKSYYPESVIKIDEYTTLFGGFSLIGDRIFSNSLYQNYSTLVGKKDDIPKFAFKAYGPKFEVKDSTVTADYAEFSAFFENDSISHPRVQFNYYQDKEEIQTYNLKKGSFKNSYYSDTFHKVDIKSDAMHWYLNTGKMEFYILSGRTELPALFESFDYYNENRLRFLSNNAGFNPLITAGNLVFTKKKNVFSQPEIEKIVKKEPFIISNGLLLGREMGFFDYNEKLNLYRLSRKGLHYFKVSRGLADYDDLILTSVTSEGNNAANASIDLNSKSIDLVGAQNFKLSDSLEVSFMPKNGEMKMVGNKEFEFKGEFTVKNYRFVGDFKVEYENLKVEIHSLDSVLFTPIALFKKGIKKEIGGNIRYRGSGIVLLNDPNNKSGRKKLEEYPKFEMAEGAIAYFNDPKRKNSFFSEAVYFENKGIKIDSLHAVDLKLNGTFVGGEVLEQFNETLRVMPDTSLGFRHNFNAPFKLYGLDSKIDGSNELVLDKSGLKTKGKLNHLAAEMIADSIFISEDSLMAYGNSGKINNDFRLNDVVFPEMKIEKYVVKWRPKADSLAIEAEKGYDFFNKSTTLTGAVVIKSIGLFGAGILERPESETISKDIKFENTSYTAKDATIKIKGKEKPLLIGSHVDILFDVAKNEANLSPSLDGFENKKDTSSIEFPFASYKTTIDQAKWNMSDQKIIMNGDLESTLFTATNPSQLGLKFNATGAEYDIKSNVLNIIGVPEIKSVDAAIIPKNGIVSIIKNGQIEPLKDAKIIVDTLNRFHTLSNANVVINSKESYTGTADLQFVNASNDTFNLKLNTFEFAQLNNKGEIVNDGKKNKKLSTIASAEITEATHLYLSPKMVYQGSIQMKAPIPALYFDGAVKPDLPNFPNLGGYWVNYSGNKKEAIEIEVGKELKDGGKPLYVGINYDFYAERNSLYPSFLSAKKSEDDILVFYSSGILRRDQENARFLVSSENNASTFSFYDDQGLMEMDGQFYFLNPNLSKYINSYGSGRVDLKNNEYDFSVLLKFDFPIPRPLIDKMASNLIKVNLDEGHTDPAIDKIADDFVIKIKNFLGEKALTEYQKRAETKHVSLPEFSPQTVAPFLFTNINFKYNKNLNTYYSVGPLSLSNMANTDINAQVPGYFEIRKSNSSEDEVYLYLDIAPGYWYYFGYKNGEMGIASSDIDVIKSIETKEKNKEYSVISVDANEAQLFKKQFLVNNLGISPEEANRQMQSKSKPKTKETVKVTDENSEKKEDPLKPVKKEDSQNGF